MTRRAWVGNPDSYRAWLMLPPDLTNGTIRCCLETHPGRRYICTRRRHHTGRHAAGDGFYIVAVW